MNQNLKCCAEIVVLNVVKGFSRSDKPSVLNVSFQLNCVMCLVDFNNF